MKSLYKSLYFFVMFFFLNIQVSCSVKKYNSVTNLIPTTEKIPIAPDSLDTFKSYNFYELKIPIYNSTTLDSCTNKRGLKIWIDSNNFYVINFYSGDSLLAEKSSVLGLDLKVKNYYGFIRKVYSYTEDSQDSEIKDQILKLKEIILPQQAKDSFKELDFDGEINGYLYGSSKSKTFVMDIFINENYYFVILKGNKKMALDFLSRLQKIDSNS